MTLMCRLERVINNNGNYRVFTNTNHYKKYNINYKNSQNNLLHLYSRGFSNDINRIKKFIFLGLICPSRSQRIKEILYIKITVSKSS